MGPQRYNRWGHGNVLYVGTTFTHEGDYRHDVPAISSRNLHDLRFAEWSFSKQSLLRIDVKYRDRFLVDYVYGFNTTDHVYFVIVQKRSHVAGHDEKGLVTRLARVCVTDANFDTYTEVTLQCGGGNKKAGGSILTAAKFHPGTENRNESVLVAAFSTPEDSSSSVCRFPLPKIERMFRENIHNCFNGSMTHRNLDYISGPVQEGKCPVVGKSGNIMDFCQVGLKISGLFPIVAAAEYALQNDRINALDYSEINGKGVVVVGTQMGKANVILLGESSSTLTEYRRPYPLLQVFLMEQQLFVLHARGMFRLPVAQCHVHSDCPACAASGNPFCGWCAVNARCTTAAECPVDGGAEKQLYRSDGRCVRLERVTPRKVDLANPHEVVRLTVRGLPATDSGHRYVCQYGRNLRFPSLALVGNVLTCPSPAASSNATFQEGAGAELPLAIVLSTGRSESVLLSTTVEMFDCRRQTRCSQCSLYPTCRWCFDSSQCMSADSGSCSSPASAACPKIVVRPDATKIPDSVPTQIRLPFVPRLPSVYRRATFYCLVTVEEAKMKIGASLVNDSVVACDRTSFKYVSDAREMPIEVSVLAGEDDVLDTVTLHLYKCFHLGRHNGINDCSLCLSVARHHDCVWCGDSCSLRAHCRSGSESRTCPQPKIHFVQPTSGPLEGGTQLTVEGSNLRNPQQQNRAEGKVAIFVGGQLCSSMSDVGSTGDDDDLGDAPSNPDLRCLTPPFSRDRNRNRNASISIRRPRTGSAGSGVLTTSVRFQYRDFAVLRATPNVGPRSGGTKLTVFGRNMNIGSVREVFLDSVPCEVDDASSSGDHLVCTLGSTDAAANTSSLSLRIDGGIRTVRFDFHFLPDPVVYQIKPLESFRSGGRTLTLHGDHFAGLEGEAVRLVVHVSEADSRSAPCVVISNRIMECLTPKVPSELPFPLYLDTSLAVGDGSSVMRLRSAFPGLKSELLYVADPVYYNFSNGYKQYSTGDALVIEGFRLTEASTKDEVKVYIGEGGEQECNVTAITNEQLICNPESPPPHASSQEEDVTVFVGPSLRYALGRIEFRPANGADSDGEIPSELIGGIGAAAAVVIFLAVVALIILKHKSSEVEREYKRIQIQMDLLENNVRSECKQAFAELQTDMTDLTMELEVTGIPVVREQTYLMNIFFPGVEHHPILIFPTGTRGHHHQAPSSPFSQLENLLMNGTFFTALVTALERQTNFSVRDKVNLASLLSVVLTTRLDYFAGLLKTLLRGVLNDRGLGAAQLGSSRARVAGGVGGSTIVDKLLTNWLSICLYDYARDHVGRSLFFLYKAVKCQVEKGPVDVFTQESRYSLCESGLLRSSSNHCDYQTVTCLVLQRELDEAYETRVLSCDSIGQVKAKILDTVYKNTAFSLRPAVDEIDLEWQCGEGAHVVLQDFDLTSVSVPGSRQRRVNTLRHYGVKNKAVVSLVPKQYGMKNGGVGGGGTIGSGSGGSGSGDSDASSIR